jgi:hypothetical protein
LICTLEPPVCAALGIPENVVESFAGVLPDAVLTSAVSVKLRVQLQDILMQSFIKSQRNGGYCPIWSRKRVPFQTRARSENRLGRGCNENIHSQIADYFFSYLQKLSLSKGLETSALVFISSIRAN